VAGGLRKFWLQIFLQGATCSTRKSAKGKFWAQFEKRVIKKMLAGAALDVYSSLIVQMTVQEAINL
jgi:hypothetical protein